MLWFRGTANLRPQMTVDAADNAEGWRFSGPARHPLSAARSGKICSWAPPGAGLEIEDRVRPADRRTNGRFSLTGRSIAIARPDHSVFAGGILVVAVATPPIIAMPALGLRAYERAGRSAHQRARHGAARAAGHGSPD